jgi:hypothetical protein
MHARHLVVLQEAAPHLQHGPRRLRHGDVVAVVRALAPQFTAIFALPHLYDGDWWLLRQALVARHASSGGDNDGSSGGGGYVAFGSGGGARQRAGRLKQASAPRERILVGCWLACRRLRCI